MSCSCVPKTESEKKEEKQSVLIASPMRDTAKKVIYYCTFLNFSTVSHKAVAYFLLSPCRSPFRLLYQNIDVIYSSYTHEFSLSVSQAHRHSPFSEQYIFVPFIPPLFWLSLFYSAQPMGGVCASKACPCHPEPPLQLHLAEFEGYRQDLPQSKLVTRLVSKIHISRGK